MRLWDDPEATTIHVDYGFVTTNTPIRVTNMLRALEELVKILEAHNGNQHQYLSMVFGFDRVTKLVSLKMPKYVNKVVEVYQTPVIVRKISTPYTKNLFRKQETAKLNREEQQKYHSAVMRIMFYAVSVCSDILCTVNYV